MVTILGGPKGTGKTRKLIDLANSELENAKGSLVFIDCKDKYSREINTSIRFINSKDFKINNAEMFFGFVCGLIAGNYDITTVYIDNIAKIFGTDSGEEIKNFFIDLDKFLSEYNVEFVVTLNIENDSQKEMFEEFNYKNA